MKQYTIWNKQDSINGVDAQHFLTKEPFKSDGGDIILIYAENSNQVSNVECKNILASVYDIDPTLPLNEFMEQYFAKLEENTDDIDANTNE